MPIAYSYSRFSSLVQSSGRSEGRQTDPAEAWCRANGYTLDHSIALKDRGKSGYHGAHLKGRSRLAAFLQVVDDGQIPRGSVLLIEHIDRLSRLPWQEGLALVQRILGAGIEIVTLLDGQRYSAGRLNKDLGCIFVLLLHLCQSNEESDKKSERLKDVWQERRRKSQETGRRVNRRCPAWLDTDTLEVIPEKADRIRLLFKYALEGNGPNRIAKVLNQERVPTMAHGQRWSAHTVRHYLTTRTVLGEFQNRRIVEGVEIDEGDPIPDAYPAIIDPVDFAPVQRSLADRSARQTRGRTSRHLNLFAGLLYSLYDGGRYHLQSNQNRSLIPYARTEGVPDSMTVSVRYDSFEEAFFRMVREIDAVALFTPRGSEDQTERLSRLQVEMAEVQDRIAATKARIKTSKSIEVLLSLVEEMEVERKALAKEIETLKSRLVTSESQIFADLRTILGDPQARVKIASTLRLLVDRIELLPIHRKTGRWRKTQYFLYVEVHFHNGQVRYLVTDEEGSSERQNQGYAITGYTVMGADVDTARRVIIPPLILEASDEWRPRLMARFPGLPASHNLVERYRNAGRALEVLS